MARRVDIQSRITAATEQAVERREQLGHGRTGSIP
jgi:hypothetical protein